MPDPKQCVQSSSVRRCVITASGANLAGLIQAAINTQVANLGDTLIARAIGCRIVTASASFTVSNADGTGTLTIAAGTAYEAPAVAAIRDTIIGGGATLGVELYFN